MSELRDLRLDRLEEDVRDIKVVLARLEPLVIRIDQRLTSELPQLATKAELADKPGKVWLATAIGVLVAYAAGLAGIAALPVIVKLGAVMGPTSPPTKGEVVALAAGGAR